MLTNSKVEFIICCSGLNFLDLMVRQGTIDNPPKPPLVPGFECSGIVESVGENTKGFEVSEVTGCGRGDDSVMSENFDVNMC